MIQIRTGIFETNSSSVHAIAYCTVQEFNDFLDGKLFFDTTNATLVPANRDFDKNQLSYREVQRIIDSDYFDQRVSAELKALSDGTQFGVIKYDYES